MGYICVFSGVLLLFLSVFVMIVLVMLSVAFLTLYERHLLGLSQSRLGPINVSVFAIMQPLFDGLKLFNNELLYPFYSSRAFFVFTPSLVFVMLFLQWLVVPYFYNFCNFELSVLFFLCLLGFMVYFILLLGVFSNSKYSFLGSIRSSSQSISFEVVFFFFVFCFMFLFQSFYFSYFCSFMTMWLFFVFVLLVLVELNRAPFDFAEGESELVSGFNLEFGSVFFVLLFLSEYGFIVFFSFLLSCFLFGGSLIFSVVVYSLLLVVRSAFPRYRYDFLICFFWFVILPLSIYLFYFFFFVFLIV